MEYEALERDGLILVAQVAALYDVTAISRDVGRGLLVQLRRGAYVRRTEWDRASLREQHIFRIRSVVAEARRPVLVAGHSAAAVWGMPIASEWPNDVLLLDERKGGGHVEPGVKRTCVGFSSASPVLVDGIPVTSLARTALDVARRATFTDSVGSIDWALWRKNPRAISRADIDNELALVEDTRGFRAIQRAVSFANSLSDSFGESEARAVIHLLGFAAPEQQVDFRDPQGVIRPDFYWRQQRVAVEFDGKLKYMRDEFTAGDPGDVVWREKKREDRLRRLDVRVSRILTEDVKRPQRLERVLLDAGIPRVTTPSGRRTRSRAEL